MSVPNFTGAVAIITGGASGIGRATAQALYTRGAHIVLADINKQGLQETEDLLRKDTSAFTNHVTSIPTDVTDEQQVQLLMRQAVEIHGRIDLVVTSAGVGRGGAIDTYPASEMQKMMNINFMGTYHCTQAALPAMRQQRSGHFVFLSSVAGKLCTPMLSAYCATKWAIRGFSSALRAELHNTGIGVTTVYPAWVDTPMIHQEAEEVPWMPIHALLTPQQVAEEIVQAVMEDRRDLTLAPNPDIALLLQIIKDDPDKAEMLVGEAFYQQMSAISGKATL